MAYAGRRGIGMRQPLGVSVVLAGLVLGGSAATFMSGVWFAPAAALSASAIAFTAVAVDSFRRERARKAE